MNIGRLYRFLVEIRESIAIGNHLKIIREVLNEDSFFPEMKRKSRSRRRFENIGWYIKNKESCRFYNSYGFDVVGFRNKKDYIPYRKFRKERNNENYSGSPVDATGYVGISILRNKILFALFIGSCLGKQYTAANEGLLEKDGMVLDYSTNERVQFIDYLNGAGCDLFIKKIDGECGAGCCLIKKDAADKREFADSLKGSSYIIQKVIVQHDELNKINPSCVNTIRIITVRGKSGEPHVFAHMLRLGVNSDHDNRATGGIGVGITEDGSLMKDGMGHHFRVTKHPVTGFVFEGYKLPYWDEIKQLVIKAHSLIPDVVSIGWDVAITPTGPVLIEGNDNWEITGPQDTMGGLKKKWRDIHEM